MRAITSLSIFFLLLAFFSEVLGAPISRTSKDDKTALTLPKAPIAHTKPTPAPVTRGQSPKAKHTAKVGGKDTPPPLPTVDECKAQLNLAKDTSLFYAGPNGYAKKAREWIKADQSRKNYQIMGQKWKDSSWQNQWQKDPDISKKFFDICSQAMAEGSSGTVYVMLPSDTKGKDWHKGTVWDEYEWPHLGSGVSKVIRVNPDNNDQETIKGQGTAQKPPPTQKPPVKDSCDVSYKFFFDSFEVRGKNFPGSTLGKNGLGLLADLRHCGVVSDWNFQSTPKDPTYQWYASGRLPIGVKNCVGSAVMKAGGSSAGNCHGAG